MGLLEKLFKDTKATEEKKALLWIPLIQKSQLKRVSDASFKKPQLLFKHSTRCGISRMVLNQFERENIGHDMNYDMYFLDLLNYRGISQEIVTQFSVVHESPQMLVIKNGEVVSDASHGAINEVDLAKFI